VRLAGCGNRYALRRNGRNPIAISPKSLLRCHDWNRLRPFGSDTTAGQLDRPYPQYTGLKLAGQGNYNSTYHSLQLTLERRFAGAGSLLVAYTNAKLISDADTLTNWLEASSGSIQDFNNLKGERSLSSQDVPQRLVISYVLDLPFGPGKKYFSSSTGVMDKLVGGWGIDGVTIFQSGFPLVFRMALQLHTLFGAGSRPNVVSGCNKSAPSGGSAKLSECSILPASRHRRTSPSAMSHALMRTFARPASITGTSPCLENSFWSRREDRT